MVRGNRTLTGRAASGLIGRPSGAGERHIKKNDHEQTDACGNGTPSIVTRSVHVFSGRYISSDNIAWYAIVRKPVHQRDSLTFTLYANPASPSRRRKPSAALGERALRRSAVT